MTLHEFIDAKKKELDNFVELWQPHNVEASQQAWEYWLANLTYEPTTTCPQTPNVD